MLEDLNACLTNTFGQQVTLMEHEHFYLVTAPRQAHGQHGDLPLGAAARQRVDHKENSHEVYSNLAVRRSAADGGNFKQPNTRQ